MATILPTKSIYYNDVNILPKLGIVKSRKDVSRELHKIIISPMSSIVGRTFIKEASKLGLSVAIPRFLYINEKIVLHNLFEDFRINDKQLCFIGIGLGENADNLKILDEKLKTLSILIDMADCYIPQLEEKVYRISEHLGNIHNLLIGNIVTIEGLKYMYKSLDYFCNNLFCRVGIGNGQPCKSSDVAAINRGQITELIECEPFKKEINSLYNINEINKKLYLVSDGGISKSGFCLKAFGAGSDYCLMGGYWKNAIEAEANVTGNGIYFGCASETQNKLAGLDRHSEGKEIQINKYQLKPLKELVDELWGGISSGISYVGCNSVEAFVGQGVFELKINSLPPKLR
ncbi:MAG: IMP dehydrogenase, partial [Nanoarchaeota archaeon]